jgi:peptidoglycan/LPS O-acetylase OafA/YrhL
MNNSQNKKYTANFKINGHIDQIDFLRGVAILLVFFFHFMIYLFPGYQELEYDSNNFLIIKSLRNFILNFNPAGQGWVGVELFLIISGFLIHFSYLNQSKLFTYRFFFSKRFWRIYPPYILCLLFFYITNGVYTMDISHEGIKSLILHILLLHNFSQDTFYSINPSFWSIALEVQLYLIYPLFIFISKKKNELFTFFLSLLVYLIYLFIELRYAKDVNLTIHFSIIKYWFVWCSGAFLASYHFENKKLFKRPIRVFLFSFLLFFVIKLNYVTNMFNTLFAVLAFLAFIEIILHLDIRKNWINYLFRFIMKFGVISYSIYLIHQPFLVYLLDFYNPASNFPVLNISIQFIFTFITLVLISISFYSLVELKSIEFGNYFRKKGN